MNKLLLIVDPQVDFISGTLPVPGAREAMDSLALYISEHGNDYKCIVITADWHPYHHMSFVDQGGQWPRHCVAFSEGAAIDAKILETANNAGNAIIMTKGTERDREEYSIFQNGPSGDLLRFIVDDLEIDQIDICGLAGDICVANTANDAINLFGSECVTILDEFSPKINA